MSEKNLLRAEARSVGLTIYKSDRLCIVCQCPDRYVCNNICVQCSKARVSRALRANPEKFRQNAEKWRKNNPDKVSANLRKWVQDNLNRYNQVRKEWRRKNPDKVARYRATNRALYHRRIRQATPKWANLTKIKEIYIEAARLGMSVDHVYPLHGRDVCGLHVENNLRIISKSDNSSKGNRPLKDR